MTETNNKPLIITKKTYKDFFTIPSIYWFKTNEEIKKINQHLNFEQQEDYEVEEDWLEQIFNNLLDDESVNLLFNQQDDSLGQKLTKLLAQADLNLTKNFFFFYDQFCKSLNQFIQKQFNWIDVNYFYDHRIYYDANSSTAKFWELINCDHDWIIFKPKLKLEQFLLTPTCIIRSNKKIYYIEAFLCSSQKLVNVLPLIFAEKVLETTKAFNVDCYLTCLIRSSVTEINPEQFILSANFPLGQKVHINNLFAQAKKQGINKTIAKTSSKQINYYCRLYNKPFHFIKDLEPDLMVTERLNLLKASRPISSIFNYQQINEQTRKPTEQIWKNRLKTFNINDLLNKKLTIDDYPLQFDQHELFNTYYNSGIKAIFKNSYYLELLKQKDSKNTLLTLVGLIDQKSWPQIENGELLTEPTTVPMKIRKFQWPGFLTAITNHWNKDQNQLPVVNQRYWIEQCDVNNIFKNNWEWKNLLIKVFPGLNFSGRLADFKTIYQKASQINQPINLNNQQAIAQTFLIEQQLFEKYGFKQQFLITFKAWERIKTYEKVTNRIYYDFETYALPISNINNVASYAQIVYQAAIIKDVNGSGIKNCQNLLYDPLKINPSVFKEIIDQIYHPNYQNTAYIVYNKNFENNRLIEMAKQIDETDYYQKVQIIINNTIDLADFFNYSKNNVQIIVKDLKGFYSIKKVIEILPKKYLTQAQAVSFQKLEKIQNGLICQSLAINRALDQNITDLKETIWLEQAELMKKYCENDVRAMIAIDYWIVALLQAANAANQIYPETDMINLIFNKNKNKIKTK